MSKELLHGGREGKIKKKKDKVLRPANLWTPYVHAFLTYMHENGFSCIPKPYGITEDGTEMVSYVEGVVYHDSLPEEIMTDEVLIEVAGLLRRYHDIGAGYVLKLEGNEPWMLEKRSPAEVMCHGDFAPYNLTFADGHVQGMIDFDTLHPGPRLWDIAYAVYRWVPFVSPQNPDYRGDLEHQLQRVRLFAEAYGLDEKQREQLPDMMIERLQALVTYMKREAEAGNRDVLQNIADGHMKMYLDDMQYIKDNLK